MLRRLSEFKDQQAAFKDIEIDHQKEFWEAIRLGGYESSDVGLAEITHRRTYTRPSPPVRAISTIHKAKGLECESVVMMLCDARTSVTRRTPAACCTLLWVGNARLQLVVSRANPSPLLVI